MNVLRSSFILHCSAFKYGLRRPQRRRHRPGARQRPTSSTSCSRSRRSSWPATRYKGLCPFHREKTPSFTVDRGKGLFYCFGCGTGGDVFKFLVLTERFTFPEAVEHVAARVGIELPRKRRTQRESDKDDLLEVIDDASEAFHQALGWGDNIAQHYLRERRVVKEIVTKYGFGYAPDSWDYLLRRLGQKHGEKRLELAGLITPRKEGKAGFYDRFRNRLMIPIHSETGALVGFGGRSLDGGEPKYLNSPESELFNKSRLLYNLHRSKDAMRRYDRAILVEGYFDAIAIDLRRRARRRRVDGNIADRGTGLATAALHAQRRDRVRRRQRRTQRHVESRAGTARSGAQRLRAGPARREGSRLARSEARRRSIPRGARQRDRHLRVRPAANGRGDVAQLSGREKSERVEQFMPLLSAVTDPVVRNDAAQRIADAFRLEFETVWSRVRGKATSAAPQERQRIRSDRKRQRSSCSRRRFRDG